MDNDISLQMSGGDLGVSAFPDGESIFTWIGTIEGGKGTMYEGLSYKLSLHFPLDYPFKPPQVKFETMCFHPNVDQFGNICLDILQVLTFVEVNKSLPGLPFPVVLSVWIYHFFCLLMLVLLCLLIDCICARRADNFSPCVSIGQMVFRL